MLFTRIYLDTNTIIRAFEGLADDDFAQDMIGMFGLVKTDRSAAFVTSHITLAEALVHPIRRNDAQAQFRYKLLLSRSDGWLQVRHISQAVLDQAATLRATLAIKLPDAIHSATAMLTGCSHVLTSDTDFKPLTGGRPSDLPVAIRPTRATVDEIIAWLRS